MLRIRPVLFPVLSIAAIAAPVAAQTAPDPAATAAKVDRDNARYAERRMAERGFVPMAEMRFAGRDVRRVLPSDPYGMMPIPGVEMERHRDGRMTIRIVHRGWTSEAKRVSQTEWDAVARLQGPAFAPWRDPKPDSRPDVVSHCWSGMIAASPDAHATWGCASTPPPAAAYASAMMMLALDKYECAPADTELGQRFADCFTDKGVPDNAMVAARLAEARAKWQALRLDGPDLLMPARRALGEARQQPTPERIAAARAAVLAFGQRQRALREVVSGSFRDIPRPHQMSVRDAAIVEQTRDQWLSDIAAQTGNYTGMLEELAGIGN
ncbi:hypothetical protein NYR55_10860 [Sphingomonas sp. BGYR3]|uniref:hypothetical protein n=1 Tax=Sphingomonas sp. BGYR3 TaxID=2975483 RepID=UPI0021A85F15|nr:hypothetical protein [Sphingomonas sp. BGYR3]MDG5489113.1 hypothetical protein [Sphingomonas sp. BGYR3]